MKDREPKRVSLWLLFVLVVVALIVVFDIAYGDDDDHHDRDDSGGDISVNAAPEVNTSLSSSTRGYSFSGGDMAIRDCIATHSVLFGLWQGTHINKLCEAERLNRDGKYQAAAEMKCSIGGIRRVYPKGECVDAVILSAPPPIPLPVMEDDEDEEEEWREEQMQMQVSYDSRIAQLEAQLSEPPQIIEKTVVRVPEEVAQQIDKDAARRAKSRASLSEYEK